MRVLGEPSAAAFSLKGCAGVQDVQVVGTAVQVEYLGGDETVAAMVAHLVHRDIGVVGVEQDRNELERIFLQATQRQPAGGSS